METTRTSSNLQFELIDLKDWLLPSDDEPHIPALGIYTQTHTRNWSHKVSGACGFILVAPQYNWGYPAPLKNALDHLCKEWQNKPVSIFTYGARGGHECAAQLLRVAEGMKMRATPTTPAFTLSRDVIMGGAFDARVDLAAYSEIVTKAVEELASMVDEQ